LLRTNLDELITGPAIDKKGHPTSSQFIMNVVLKTTPRDQDTYDANFAYLSTSPVPPGSWYWVHINGHRLALASRNGLNQPRRYFRQTRIGDSPQPHWQHYNAPTPAFRSAPAPAPVAPPRSH
jgi:hypothetical protein